MDIDSSHKWGIVMAFRVGTVCCDLSSGKQLGLEAANADYGAKPGREKRRGNESG